MLTIPSAIKPKKANDRARWLEQSLRLRMLTGEFEQDVRDDIRRLFAAEIAADLELAPDLSRNTFLLVHQQLATSYLEAPLVTAEGVEDTDLTPIMTARLWPIQRENELKLRALNESVIRLDWSNNDSEVRYRIVDPDALVLIPDKDYPDRAHLGKDIGHGRSGILATRLILFSELTSLIIGGSDKTRPPSLLLN